MDCKTVLRNLLLIFFAIVTLSWTSLGQNKPFWQPNEILLISGFGHGTSSYNLPEGTYRPVYFIVHLSTKLWDGEKHVGSEKLKMLLYIEPQFNPVLITQEKNVKQEFETGLNIGVKHVFALTKFFQPFIHMGFGPHYFSAETVKQTKGFLFSDNLGCGISLLPTSHLTFQLGFRLRHLSNANTRWPNHGINTYNYHVGVGWVF